MKLNRENLARLDGRPVESAEERIVHIGLGAFHRAHQAWYTSQSDFDQSWGIVAFTGRSPEAATTLAAQDGLFTLITRDANGDSYQIIDSIVRCEDGNDTEALVATLENPRISIVTLTITEAGYGMDNEGHVDVNNPPVALQRLALALEARRLSVGLGLAIVPCDNMPSNGHLLKVAMTDLMGQFSQESVDWLLAKVSFVSTSIDRITPKTLDSDVEAVANATGWHDDSPVVTEPFRDWVLEGEFPLGRPEWERAGAKFVNEIEPFENRKLWLLNGTHSLLAYAGQLRGHETVADAIADEFCAEAVEALFDAAGAHLTAKNLDVSNYRHYLLARYHNPRIAHRLAQIAMDGSTKLRVRIAPVAKLELAAGREASAAAFAFASWIGFVQSTNELHDSRAEQIKSILLSVPEPAADLVALVDADLATHPGFMKQVVAQLELQKI